MAYRTFLKAEGISGGSTAPGHSGEIDLESYSLGAPSSAVGGGNASGKVNITEFNFTKLVDATSSIFFTKCAAGEKINKATVTVEKPQDDKSVLIMKYEFEGVLVTSITFNATKDPSETPLESITFNFAKIAFQYFQTKP